MTNQLEDALRTLVEFVNSRERSMEVMKAAQTVREYLQTFDNPE